MLVFVEKFTDHKPRKKCNDFWSWNLPSRKLKKWRYFVEKVKYKKPTENVLIFVEISTDNKSRIYKDSLLSNLLTTKLRKMLHFFAAKATEKVTIFSLLNLLTNKLQKLRQPLLWKLLTRQLKNIWQFVFNFTDQKAVDNVTFLHTKTVKLNIFSL